MMGRDRKNAKAVSEAQTQPRRRATRHQSP